MLHSLWLTARTEHAHCGGVSEGASLSWAPPIHHLHPLRTEGVWPVEQGWSQAAGSSFPKLRGQRMGGTQWILAWGGRGLWFCALEEWKWDCGRCEERQRGWPCPSNYGDLGSATSSSEGVDGQGQREERRGHASILQVEKVGTESKSNVNCVCDYHQRCPVFQHPFIKHSVNLLYF